jgi:XTP/dITP diphosphohydrolase
VSAPEWVLASGNPGKLAEIRALWHAAGLREVRLRAQTHLGVVGPAETGATFVENAVLKARHAARVTGLPAIADDSGIAVDTLGTRPACAPALRGWCGR